MKTICTLLISFFILSSIAMAADESSKPENCFATRSTEGRYEGKNISSDEEEQEEIATEVQSN